MNPNILNNKYFIAKFISSFLLLYALHHIIKQLDLMPTTSIQKH